jgi:hypothetical protein
MMWPFKKKPITQLELTAERAIAPDGQFFIGHDVRRNQPVLLSEASMARSVVMLGQAGSGKTSLQLLVAFQQIQRGGGLAFVQGHAEDDTLQSLWEFACLCGREKDLLVLNADHPDKGNSYNPVMSGTPGQIADRCMLVMPPGGSPGAEFYRNEARQHLVRVTSCLQEAGLAFNLSDLAILTSHRQALVELVDKAEAAAPQGPAAAALRDWLELVVTSSAHLKALLGGLAGRLAQLGFGRMAAVLGDYQPEIDFASAIQSNKIIYIGLPAMGKNAHQLAFNKMLIADLQAAYEKTKAPAGDGHQELPFLRLIEDTALDAASTGGVMQSLRYSSGALDSMPNVGAMMVFKLGAEQELSAAASLVGLDEQAGRDQIRALRLGQFFLHAPAAESAVHVQTPRLSIQGSKRADFGSPRLNKTPKRVTEGAAFHLEVERYLRLSCADTHFDATEVAVSTH